ncbi:hypothetical protein C1886_25940 [Pseudomonas sp. FW300-N1A1]|nr:hypothetical protein C1886_25940 [Pseudomonas sp. FW300-N1A1]
MLVYISVVAVMAAGGFALTARHFWQAPQKYPKGLAPSVRPLAEARGSLASAFLRGHRPPVGFARPPVGFARPPCDVLDCVEGRYAPFP